MQHPAQRVGVFVDVQNMYYSARALFEQKVDFGQILKEAIGDRHVIRAFAYVISAENEDEGSFFNALQDRGYELRTKQLLNFYGGNSKGDWDVGIAMDVVKLLPKLDVVVLVSGDGDFAELLSYVKSRGVRAEVMAFGSSASSQLRQEADAVFDLAQDPKRFLIPKKTQPISKKPRTLESQALIQLEEGIPATASSQRTERGGKNAAPVRAQQAPQQQKQSTEGKPFSLPDFLQKKQGGRREQGSQSQGRSSNVGQQRTPQPQQTPSPQITKKDQPRRRRSPRPVKADSRSASEQNAPSAKQA